MYIGVTERLSTKVGMAVSIIGTIGLNIIADKKIVNWVKIIEIAVALML